MAVNMPNFKNFNGSKHKGFYSSTRCVDLLGGRERGYTHSATQIAKCTYNVPSCQTDQITLMIFQKMILREAWFD
jgi:hypothetical protein